MTQSGRAGRDGEPSECILLYAGQDVVTNQFFIDNNMDNQELDPVTRAIVQERDRERLRKMTFYCFTNECLRDYILRYFGEYGSNYCGNCSNCLSQFEEVDVTEIAKGLIGCVESCRQRYGINVIIDTVHGANTAKIRNYRMDESPQYGILAKTATYKLRQVMNYLQLNEYLTVTNDEYAIVKLTERSKSVLEEEAPVVMKMAKEQDHPAKVKTEKGKKSRKNVAAGFSGADFTENDEALFEKLRALRAEIAKEEKVPPYIVFSDKTLTHMCVVKPGTKTEMLAVSGVGEFKYAKYGERFLQCVKENAITSGETMGSGAVFGQSVQKKTESRETSSEYAQEYNPEYGRYDGEADFYYSSDEEDMADWTLEAALTAWENGSEEKTAGQKDGEYTEQGTGKFMDQRTEKPETGSLKSEQNPAKGQKTKKTQKVEFMMTEELAGQLHYSARVTLSDYVGQINDLRDEEQMKRLTIKSVEQMLLDEGLLEIKHVNRMPLKRLTEKGEKFGIEVEIRLSEKGNEYEVFYYTEAAQQRMTEWLLSRI